MGSFNVWIDPRHGLLRVRFTGFLTPALVADYLVARDEALVRLGCAPNGHLTLCDFSSAVPQSQDVLAAFKRSLEDPRTMSRRIAVVVTTAIARLQAQRIVTRGDAAVFSDVVEAEAWLLSDGTPPPAPIEQPATTPGRT